jgi:hypothetical protein
MNTVVTVEYDKDDNRIYAWVEKNGEFVRDFASNEELDKFIQGATVISSGRWDGETSTKLCPEYNGNSCTSGGANEVYEVR